MDLPHVAPEMERDGNLPSQMKYVMAGWTAVLNSDSAFSPGTYADVRKRLLGRLRSAGVSDQVLEVLRTAFEEALAVDHLVLSRVERERLLMDVLMSELGELTKRLDERGISNGTKWD